MTETSVSSYGTQYGLEHLWHHMDWLLRIDVAVLGIVFACTLISIVRVSRSYRLALHEKIDTPAGKRLVAELKGHVRNLKSIGSTATYFGLLGTCFGILSTFVSLAMAKQAYVSWIASKMAAALVPCTAAIVVAVAATCGYTYGGTRLDLLEPGLPRRNCLLRKHFAEFASFGLIAAWLLAVLIRVYFLPFTPLANYRGFDVGIASAPCDTSDRFVVLRLPSRGGIYLNWEEEHDWRSLQSRLSEIYSMRADRVLYLSADEGVPFQTVADAIDTVRSTPWDITVLLVTPRAGCPEPRVLRGSTRHPSR